MIKIGEYQVLFVQRKRPQGVYLGARNSSEEVLLPRKFINTELQEGDPLEVFIYNDNQGLPVATTEQPFLTLGQIALLEVKDVNKVGAFCDWGVAKQLFIPFRNQLNPLEAGQHVVVYLYLDKETNRLVGTTKIKPFLQTTADPSWSVGQTFELLVYEETDLGYKAIVNHTYSGLLYKNELPGPLQLGTQIKGYLKPLREDGKIDLGINPIGASSIEPNAELLLAKLKANDGFLPFTDKSDPEAIRATFGISKKLFKKALGSLYRQRIVELTADGVSLVNS